MSAIRMPPRQSLTSEWRNPETVVPADALSPLSPSAEAALLADAREMHQADDDIAPYIDGWRWGFTCGVCATLIVIALAFAIGRVITPLF